MDASPPHQNPKTWGFIIMTHKSGDQITCRVLATRIIFLERANAEKHEEENNRII